MFYTEIAKSEGHFALKRNNHGQYTNTLQCLYFESNAALSRKEMEDDWGETEGEKISA
jgi:hypothetical protein